MDEVTKRLEYLQALSEQRLRLNSKIFYDPMKHTNLPNEITGAYYKEPTSWITIILVTLGVLIVTLAIADLFFPEVVTEALSEVVMLFR